MRVYAKTISLTSALSSGQAVRVQVTPFRKETFHGVSAMCGMNATTVQNGVITYDRSWNFAQPGA